MKKIVKKSAVTTTATKGKANAKAQSAKAQPTAPAATSAQKKAGINSGVKTGMRVMLFQDLILATNDASTRPAPVAHIPTRLTDAEIAKVWREEFPNSRAVLNGRIDENIVRGVRQLFNNGTGDHGTPGKVQQTKPWVIGDGNKRVQAEYTRTRKVGEPKADAPAKAKATVPVAEAAKAAARVVTAKAAAAVASGKKKIVVKRRAA